MTLSQDRLETKLAGRAVRFFPQIGSTNDFARRWLSDGAASGALVVTDEQVTGRGRLGRQWLTPPGTAIAASLILRPQRDAFPQMTMLGALAVAEMLDGLGLSGVSIKWPNDVRIEGRKVCGVLVEATWQGDQLLGVVLGMGINVRVDFSDTPLADTAASIEPALGQRVDRADILAALLARIDHWLPQLGTEALFIAWKSRLDSLGQTITIKRPHGDLSGVAEAVEADGTLCLRAADGVLHRVVAGDITPG